MTLKSLTKQQEQESVLKRVFYTLSTAGSTIEKTMCDFIRRHEKYR